MKNLLCGVLLALISVCVCSGEFYTSTENMIELKEMEQNLTQNLCTFITAEKQCLEIHNMSVLQICGDPSEDSPEDLEEHVGNPFRAYKLLGRLRRRWRMAERVAHACTSREFPDALSCLSGKLPSQSDLDGAALSLVRLQAMYGFPQSIMGKNTGREPVPLLDPDELFHVAKVALQNYKFQHALQWLNETLRLLDGNAPAVVTRKEVLSCVGGLAFQMGDLPLAQELTQQALTLDPDDLETAVRWHHYQALTESILQRGGTAASPPSVSELLRRAVPATPTPYESLCRGEATRRRPGSRLVCRYSTGGGHPLLRYAPVREEEEWDAPAILRYHHFLSETEMEIIKNLSRSKLARAQVSHSLTGTKPSHQRIAKSAWLSEEDHPVVSLITQRMAAVSGLNMQTAEMLQVANYGIGGQYEPHYDFKETNDSDDITRGNRIATILIYMTDVEVGGATVFPHAGASLQPRKGSAVLWYNLLQSGEVDRRTLHAGCPVYMGNKWVANKWVRSAGQEFRRRCSLSRNV